MMTSDATEAAHPLMKAVNAAPTTTAVRRTRAWSAGVR